MRSSLRARPLAAFQSRRWLTRQGFTPQRAFTRMLLGRADPFDRPERVMAITGPEFG